ncbi:hypothetical protein [Tenacibaculum sp. nBUS_03]|uniref:hypothetical protein n=1 Tax=Tenacibaculum sp. nBUS_03 TaxID=3395320 RepID=UPI003EB8A02C
MIRKVIIIVLIISLSSCKKKSISLETKNFNLEISSVYRKHGNFKNQLRNYPLFIDADKIDLKEVLGILLRVDTSIIKIRNKELKNQFFNVFIEPKNSDSIVNKTILTTILDEWNLRLEEKNNKSYAIEILDSTKYNNFKSTKKNFVNYVYNLSDSIKVSNCNLKKIAEVLNSEYAEEIVFNNESKRINYTWKKIEFDDLQTQLQHDLGVSFLDTKEDIKTFIISDK